MDAVLDEDDPLEAPRAAAAPSVSRLEAENAELRRELVRLRAAARPWPCEDEALDGVEETPTLLVTYQGATPAVRKHVDRVVQRCRADPSVPRCEAAAARGSVQYFETFCVDTMPHRLPPRARFSAECGDAFQCPLYDVPAPARRDGCFNCGVPGHAVRDCPVPRDDHVVAANAAAARGAAAAPPPPPRFEPADSVRRGEVTIVESVRRR